MGEGKPTSLTIQTLTLPKAHLLILKSALLCVQNRDSDLESDLELSIGKKQQVNTSILNCLLHG